MRQAEGGEVLGPGPDHPRAAGECGGGQVGEQEGHRGGGGGEGDWKHQGAGQGGQGGQDQEGGDGGGDPAKEDVPLLLLRPPVQQPEGPEDPPGDLRGEALDKSIRFYIYQH